MSGHSKFSKIKHKKAIKDDKRSKIFMKAIRDIQVAVLNGGSDPSYNSKLKMAMLAAKAVNLPRIKIEDAIKKADSRQDAVNLKEAMYEGYIESVAVIVEALTDQLTRTYNAIRIAFTKAGGSLSPEGTVKHNFQNLGFITYPGSVKTEDEMLELALEAGADDCQLVGDEYEIYSQFEHMHKVREQLEKVLGEASDAKFIWKPNHLVKLDSDEKLQKVLSLFDTLEDFDEVRHVWSNLDVPADFEMD